MQQWTVRQLLEALEFYAKRENYNQRGWQGDPEPSHVDKDRGQRARDALAGVSSPYACTP
jgi:hypothetical protein